MARIRYPAGDDGALINKRRDSDMGRGGFVGGMTNCFFMMDTDGFLGWPGGSLRGNDGYLCRMNMTGRLRRRA